MLPLSKTHPSFDVFFDLFRPFFSFKRYTQERRSSLPLSAWVTFTARSTEAPRRFLFFFFSLVRTAEKEFPFFSSTLSLCSFSTCGWRALLESCSSRLLPAAGAVMVPGIGFAAHPKVKQKTYEQTRINQFRIVSKIETHAWRTKTRLSHKS